ncbi:hypothetical protein [Streptomyces albipurpureus]|uniref:Uncharacterized protein n=1 Tax=Streptomyces albipurpureus TaxID=2897419 RepID=A0ABT0UIX9_9ACTN|nr:hypothetical protein [Streptomyces sp. CWNU-1]MCM2388131.1 hypothetical protein [Streptomyces sp. CWNU-1]
MNDENGSKDSGVGPVAFLGLSMQTLRARMAPAEYKTLAKAVHQFCHLITNGGPGSFEIDDTAFTPGLHQEPMTVSHTDHHYIDMPSPKGTFGGAMVQADIAEDPEQLQAVRAKLNTWWAQREAEDATLDGIARASGLDTQR